MAATPENAQHLYLVRHGETTLNAEGRLRGLANPPLDETGVGEAIRLAGVLTQKAPSIVISSPLERAVHTARIISEQAGVANETDERFNDRDYGPQTGKVKADVIAEWGSVDDAPGVEPLTKVLARARPAIDAILDEVGGRSVVVVTHDAVIRLLLGEIDPRTAKIEVPTGSWNDLVRSDGIWTVLATGQKPSV